MEILTDFDGLQEAMKKINLDESVMPYVNGRLVDSEAYNKTQKILNCPEMISAHKFLYNLDMDQLTEEEVNKINSLYKLGCDRGFISDDLTDWDDDSDKESVETTVEVKPEEKPVSGTLFKAKIPCWTIIYSATKDGDIKTGEAYSNAVSPAAAKADVNAKLSRIGYQNITILAIEASDDCAGNAQSKVGVEENDMLNGRPHNNHVSEADDTAEEDSEESDDTEDSVDDTEEDVEDTEEDTEEDADDESTDEDTSDDTTENTEDANSEKEDSEEDKEDSEKEDSDKKEDEDNSTEEDVDDSEDAESNDDSEEKDELDANEKSELRDEYRRAFKNVLSKCKFTTSFNDLTLEQKVKFFTELLKAWKKNEPNEFMTDKEIEQLNNVVVKAESDKDDAKDEDKE